MALFIGAYLPDRQLDESIFCKALTKVAIDLAQYRQHPLQSTKPNVDLYFLMPGKEENPAFEGMRFHSYNPETHTLRIESSVPKRMIQSQQSENYVVAAMQDAVDGASDFFSLQDIGFLREEYLQLIDIMSVAEGASIH